MTCLLPHHLRFDAALVPAEPGPAPADVDATLEEAERRHIELVLRAERGNVQRAAGRLGIPRSSLYQKIKRYGIPLAPPHSSSPSSS